MTDTTTDATPPDTQPDGGENLDLLAFEAGALDTQPDQAANAAKEQQALDLVQNNAAELLATLMMARGLSLPILPRHKAELLSNIWNDEVLKQASEAGAAVLALHGQSMGNMLGKYAPYIVLIGVLARPVLETREILTRPEPKPIPVRTENANG